MAINVPASEIIHENDHRFISGRHTGLRTLSCVMVCMDCGAIRRSEGNPHCCAQWDESHAAAPVQSSVMGKAQVAAAIA